MAATGFTPISTYYTTTASAVPTAGNLVNGELALNINTADGKLFYKDSAGVVQVLATRASASGSFTSITDSGNLTFTGTGNRILGDFSNATISSRVAFQTSSTNNSTFLQVLPNGTGTTASIDINNNSDPTNTSRITAVITSSTASIQSAINGTGTYLPLTFFTNGSEAMRITNNNFVGIGSSAPVSKLEVDGTSSINGSNATYVGTVQINESVATAQAVGGLEFKSASFGSGYGWKIASLDSSGAQLTFNSRQNSATWVEAMRIDSSGNLLINTTSTSTVNTGLVVIKDPGEVIIGHPTGTVSTWGYIGFRYANTVIGSVTQAGTTGVLYNITSDQRLKENIVDAPLGNIDDVKVRSFDWKSDGSHVEYGFIAQELAEVAPYAVHQPQDPEEMMAVDYSKLVPMMIKEIQDLKQRIATLESK